MNKNIVIRGAREHNLKNVSLSIPRNKLVVITGLSGSGKSSLAFDTIYAEGQRRYLESLSAYARQFLEQMKKPAVNSVDGLSPSISIEQKNITRNPRSTVGTVTEIYDYLRLLYSRIGIPHCPTCGKPIKTQTVQQIVDQVLEYPQGTKFAVLAPIVRGKKGEYQKELMELRRQGFVRAKIDQKIADLASPIHLRKNLKHDISIYVDRLVLKNGIESRLTEAVEMATELAKGLAEVEVVGIPGSRYFSTLFACVDCATSFPELEPRSFSFNSPHGACAACSGLGIKHKFDPDLIVPDPRLSIAEGAIHPWRNKTTSWLERILKGLSKTSEFEINQPFKSVPETIQNMLLYGSAHNEVEFLVTTKSGKHKFRQAFEGVIPSLERKLREAEYEYEADELQQYLSPYPCDTCHGDRLKKEALSVFVGKKNIAEFCNLDVEKCLQYVEALKLSKANSYVAVPILKEVKARLNFLMNVGLSYLNLSRSATSLSGGESQRIRLATQIGSHLVGVLYVLDEPSIGLHQRDNRNLLDTLSNLRDLGNSVIIVEHDEETIRHADHVVDLGPGAGEHGGSILFSGPPSELEKMDQSLTGKYLSGAKSIPIPTKRRKGDDKRKLQILGAQKHNLKHIDVDFPLGTFICITGVSGSGKSSLIVDTLLEALKQQLSRRKTAHAQFEEILGLELLDKAIHVDQSPIGRTPRSNPATYTGTFTEIRSLFASLPLSKMRGYKPSRFSFNVPGGRCEPCKGDGNIKISMHFLPDVFVSCEVCNGSRYNRDTLQVLYRGKSIADVLAMPIENAAEFFERVPKLRTKLQTLIDVGLGYIQLGQSAVTLSGGEAQRIKLAKELTRRATGRTLYILDEPTTGLHFDDIKKLLQILHHLVDQGNTVVVIEHQLDVIKQADHVIDLGPEGGDKGGYVVFQGTPEKLCSCKGSHTAKFLSALLPSNH